MIFKQWRQVLDGTKTQTRRLVKPGEQLKADDPPYNPWPFSPTVLKDWRFKWMMGKTYAVQPGRGKKAVGRIRITEIRREQLQEITPQDCLAEGIQLIPNEWGTPWYQCPGQGEWKSSREAFRALWDSIHTKPGMRWHDNPETWVLTFELSEATHG